MSGALKGLSKKENQEENPKPLEEENPVEEKKEEKLEEKSSEPIKTTGGRILHSRMKKIIA
jgi:hypothetical protein